MCSSIGVSIFIGVYRLYTTPPTKRKQKEEKSFCLRFVGGVVYNRYTPINIDTPMVPRIL